MHNQQKEYNQHIAHNYPVSSSRLSEWHIPENVVDLMSDVLVQEIFFLDKFARGRATGTHNKIDSGTAYRQRLGNR
jgi:hypothetical protein